MPIFAKSSVSFTPAPAGAHVAVCIDVVDLGELEVTYNGKTKRQHKVKIVWQIDEERDDGKPFNVAKRYTLSLHEKAVLRKDLESWRGRQFNPDELQGFDLEQLIDKGCMVNVVHKQREDSTFANVSAIMKLPKGSVSPKPDSNYIRVCMRPLAEAPMGEPPPMEGSDIGITDDDVPF